MQRHPSFARELLDRGVELAVHAYTHVDLSALDYRAQAENIGMAVDTFRRLGVPFEGFRAPYLHWNEDTMRVVEEYGFRYSSNQAFWWEVLEDSQLPPSAREGMARGRAFYRPLSSGEGFALPFRRRGFVEIPVSLPDDEILLDRMYLHDPSTLRELWMRIVEESHRRGELFTLQLHPERIDFFAEVLEEVLRFARSAEPSIWTATLEEIARWWVDKESNRVTFARGDGLVRCQVEAVEGAVVLLREGGRERSVEEGVLEVPGEKLPCVGVAPGADRRALQALRDRGYVVEIGEDPSLFAIHLGALSSASRKELGPVLSRLEEFPGPLVRFAPWPRGHRSALAVTGDIDAITLGDFVKRFWGR